MTELHDIYIRKGKEGGLSRMHPWIFSGALFSGHKELQNGDWVTVRSHDDRILGTGYYSQGSIAVRILAFGESIAPEEVLPKRIKEAWRAREIAGIMDLPGTDSFRLVFAEGDALPGLIIDWYAGHAVVQCHHEGMDRMIPIIQNTLKELNGWKATFLRNKDLIKDPIHKDGLLDGDPAEHILAMEYGHRFLIDVEGGQKTGFFLDQRENRRIIGQLSEGKTVLNAFGYTGGFSVYALAGGARHVTTVDISERAMQITDRNIEWNDSSFLKKHTSLTANVFDFLKEDALDHDIIILDPPAFAKRRSSSHNAVVGYKRLNAMAMEKMKSGSILMTFSCSQNVPFQLFYDTIRAAGIESRREIRVLQRLVQPMDHPVRLSHPEGEYLKGLLLEIV